MKYYYLNCAPETRDIIKRKLSKFVDSPFLVVDRLQDCDEMLIVGRMTPDMINLQEEARRLNILIRNIDTRQLDKTSARSRQRTYERDF